MNKARVESFSDSVFAFAITLLVLGVQIPEIKPGSDAVLRSALLHSLSELLPYITSFATIGIIWLNHHSMFHSVQRVEHATLTLNLLLLLVVAFIPYPTSVLSRYGALPSSAFLYGSVLTLLGITYSILAWHLERRGLRVPNAKALKSRFAVWRNLLGSIFYPVATLLSISYPRISIAVYFTLAVFYFIPVSQEADTRKQWTNATS
ncbi:MAG TPA: TMEM175 family protein [Acidobacteriaceae bacterium]